MIKLSKISDSIQPSLTRKLFNMAKEYDDVIDFTLGDPDIPTHQAIKDAGCKAIQEGKTRYSQNSGLLELRETISRYYNRKEGLDYNPSNEIIVTVGAMEGLFLSLMSILNAGDEVIIPAPYYVNYVQMVQMCNAKPIIIDNSNSGDLSFDVEDVEKAITDKTKALIINTPANPSGKLIPQDKIQALAELSKKYDGDAEFDSNKEMKASFINFMIVSSLKEIVFNNAGIIFRFKIFDLVRYICGSLEMAKHKIPLFASKEENAKLIALISINAASLYTSSNNVKYRENKYIEVESNFC